MRSSCSLKQQPLSTMKLFHKFFQQSADSRKNLLILGCPTLLNMFEELKLCADSRLFDHSVYFTTSSIIISIEPEENSLTLTRLAVHIPFAQTPTHNTSAHECGPFATFPRVFPRPQVVRGPARTAKHRAGPSMDKRPLPRAPRSPRP